MNRRINQLKSKPPVISDLLDRIHTNGIETISSAELFSAKNHLEQYYGWSQAYQLILKEWRRRQLNATLSQPI